MRPVTQIAAGLILIICFTNCRQQEDKHALYYQADSLMQLCMELQTRLSSPDIRKMHDFQEEINQDISLLSNVEKEDSSLIRYMDLYDDLGQCMQACNQFHEEAFLLESSLLEIMELIQSEERDMEKILELLQFEINNYEDLSSRIDSSINEATSKADIFYSLKPEIIQIKKELLPSPDSIP